MTAAGLSMTRRIGTTLAVLIGVAIGVATPATGGLRDDCSEPPPENPRYWDNVYGGAWSTPGNWMPNDVPDTDIEAAIVPVSTNAFEINLDMSPTIEMMRLEYPQATLNLNAETLTLERCDGLTNFGTIVANGGTSEINGSIYNQAGGDIFIDLGNTLTLVGPIIENDGATRLGTGASLTTTLSANGKLLLNGTGSVYMNDRMATINSTSNGLLTIGPDQTISGRGMITASLVNQGTLRSSWTPDSTLRLFTNDMTNSGTFDVDSGSRMEIESITVLNSNGLLLARDGEIHLETGATIVGGSLDTASNGLILAVNSAVEDVSNLGLLRVDTGDTLTVSGPELGNTGTIEVGGGASAVATMLFDSDVLLGGSGDVWMRCSSATLSTGAAATLTSDVDQVIRGRGIISAAMVNEGLVRADNNPSGTLWIRTNDKTNRGTFQATNGARMEIETVTVTNHDGLLLASAGEINLEAGAAIIGGTLNTGSGGLILAEDSGIADVTNLGLVRVNPNSTMTVSGSTLNNFGTIEVGNGASNIPVVLVDSDVLLTGNGELWLHSGTATLSTAGGATLTNDTNHAIHGQGRITAALVNDGTVRADGVSTPLRLCANDKTNRGTYEAANSARMEIEDITVTNHDGLLLASDGEIRLEADVTLIGGTLNTGSNGVIVAENSTLTDVTNLGRLQVSPMSTLTVTGSMLTNAGLIEVGNGVSNTTTIFFDSDVLLIGAGTIWMGSVNATISTNTGTTLTNDVNQHIHGRGTMSAAMVNHGSIDVDMGYPLTINVRTPGFINSGELRVSDGTITINDADLFSNSGTVAIEPGQSVTANNGYTQSGGTTTVGSASTLTVTGGVLSLNGGVLGGGGTVQGDVVNGGGAVAPGDSTATLTVSGDYTQQSGGTLSIEIGGTAQGVDYDSLNITDNAALAGTLQISLVDGFVPGAGESFQIIAAANIDGAFDTIVGAGSLEVTYTTTTVTLSQPCPLGDFDCDGDVDLADYARFSDCMAGPELSPSPTPPTTVQECLDPFDTNADADVDLHDFVSLQATFEE